MQNRPAGNGPFDRIKRIRGYKTSSSKKLLLLLLASYSDKEWSAYPSVARLVEESGLARSTVIRVLKEMRVDDELRCIGCQQRKNVWQLTAKVRQLDPSPEPKVRPGDPSVGPKGLTTGPDAAGKVPPQDMSDGETGPMVGRVRSDGETRSGPTIGPEESIQGSKEESIPHSLNPSPEGEGLSQSDPSATQVPHSAGGEGSPPPGRGGSPHPLLVDAISRILVDQQLEEGWLAGARCRDVGTAKSLIPELKKRRCYPAGTRSRDIAAALQVAASRPLPKPDAEPQESAFKPPEPPPELLSRWKSALKDMEPIIARENVNIWLKNAVPVDLNGNVLKVWFMQEEFAAWVQEYYLDDLENVIGLQVIPISGNWSATP